LESISSDFELRYHKLENFTAPFCYTDADFAADPSDRVSISGYIFFVSGGPFSWSSKKQTTVATSTMEAEYVAAFHASQQAVWIRQFSEGIGFPLPEPLVIFTDSEAALAVAKGEQAHSRSKHLDVKYHKVRERIREHLIRFDKVPTEENVADIFTKQLPRPKFHSFLTSLGFSMDGSETETPPIEQAADSSAAEVSVYLDTDDP